MVTWAGLFRFYVWESPLSALVPTEQAGFQRIPLAPPEVEARLPRRAGLPRGLPILAVLQPLAVSASLSKAAANPLTERRSLEQLVLFGAMMPRIGPYREGAALQEIHPSQDPHRDGP